jgi:CheY-like chemotaxis protein
MKDTLTNDFPESERIELVPGPRIMIVEDEVILAEMTRRILSRWGYEIVGVLTSGEEAVRQAKALKPDLILMDIRLAGAMDGLEAARQIVACRPTPVLYTTGYSYEIAENAGTVLGARSLALSKPVPPSQLKTAIESLLS